MPKTKTILSEGRILAAIAADRDRFMRAVVSVLRTARQDADLTQLDIALALGYGEDVVSNIESLRTPISFADALIWAARCSLDEAELFAEVVSVLRKRKSRKR